MAISGSEEGMRSVSLSFRKITHQMMWDLYCLEVIYSRIIAAGSFENPEVGIDPEKLFGFRRPIFFVFG
jgi:hypothetical protein